MSDNTIYLITGANKGLFFVSYPLFPPTPYQPFPGIGLALVAHLLQRPHTTVIATYRSSSSPLNPFSTLPSPNPSSTLIPLSLSTLHIPSTPSLQSLLPAHITTLDVVVANAGGTSGFRDVESTSAADMTRDFEVNAVGTAELFRVCWPLLEKKSRREPKKFVVVTSSVGSIGALAEGENFPATAYGMSKAAANWWARKVSLDFAGRGLAVGILHPG